LDGVLDHLRAHECRLLRCRLRFRSRSLARPAFNDRRFSANTARTTLRLKSCSRDLALPHDLFFATPRRTRLRNTTGHRALWLLETNCANRAERSERHGRAFPSPGRTVGILPAACVFSLHRISESDLP